MTTMHPIRKTRLAALLGCALACASAMGQVSGYGDKQTGEVSGGQLPTVLQRVGVEQFLVGPKTSIDAASQATGYGYVEVKSPDGQTSQFAHASALEVVTPEGRLAQYYMGVEYSPKDLLLGLIEASGNKIGSPVANILTYCYHYDPQTNKHSLIVARVVQVGGMITVAGLGGFMFLMFRRDVNDARDHDLTKKETDKGER